MSLDIGIADDRSTVICRDEPLLCLEDDGYYWFLHSGFERLGAETGQYIDLYGMASFEGDKRLALAQMLAEVRVLAEVHPEFFRLYVQTQSQALHEGAFKPIERRRLLSLITHWQIVVDRAQELNRAVLCVGD
ncbi:MAG: hypothetical protein JNM56_24840 [Planctomycetia bacterium]|nr:hypothetical protein [Planctomycetia bacterium]